MNQLIDKIKYITVCDDNKEQIKINIEDINFRIEREHLHLINSKRLKKKDRPYKIFNLFLIILTIAYTAFNIYANFKDFSNEYLLLLILIIYYPKLLISTVLNIVNQLILEKYIIYLSIILINI